MRTSCADVCRKEILRGKLFQYIGLRRLPTAEQGKRTTEAYDKGRIRRTCKVVGSIADHVNRLIGHFEPWKHILPPHEPGAAYTGAPFTSPTPSRTTVIGVFFTETQQNVQLPARTRVNLIQFLCFMHQTAPFRTRFRRPNHGR